MKIKSSYSPRSRNIWIAIAGLCAVSLILTSFVILRILSGPGFASFKHSLRDRYAQLANIPDYQLAVEDQIETAAPEIRGIHLKEKYHTQLTKLYYEIDEPGGSYTFLSDQDVQDFVLTTTVSRYGVFISDDPEVSPACGLVYNGKESDEFRAFLVLLIGGVSDQQIFPDHTEVLSFVEDWLIAFSDEEYYQLTLIVKDGEVYGIVDDQLYIHDQIDTEPGETVGFYIRNGLNEDSEVICEFSDTHLWELK